jgi:hypothetical protein
MDREKRNLSGRGANHIIFNFLPDRPGNYSTWEGFQPHSHCFEAEIEGNGDVPISHRTTQSPHRCLPELQNFRVSPVRLPSLLIDRPWLCPVFLLCLKFG